MACDRLTAKSAKLGYSKQFYTRQFMNQQNVKGNIQNYRRISTNTVITTVLLLESIVNM